MWSSPELGIDGVIVGSVAEGVIEGAGECDPPDGWRAFRVLLSSGAVAPGSAERDPVNVEREG